MLINLPERYFMITRQQVIHIFMNPDNLNRQAAPAQNSDKARKVAQAGAADAAQILQLQ